MPKQAPRIFGTDGIRGQANDGPLEVGEIVRLGQITARFLERRLGRRACVGLGWDTRISSPALAAAMTAGLAGGGAHVWRFGVMPTPAVSQLTRYYRLDGGVVISASHNPAADNGIKYFNGQGEKVPDTHERMIEREWARPGTRGHKTGLNLGAVQEISAAAMDVYVTLLARRFGPRRRNSVRVLVDLANGAVCRTAPPVFAALNIQAQTLADQPDGTNINEQCGSLHAAWVAQKVRSYRAQVGMAFDGDGDRVMLADENGRIINGDRMLGLLAVHYARRQRLPHRGVAATVMSNLGLELFLKAQRIRLWRAPVGDRFVSRMMEQRGLALGGEQSGHILLPRYTPTGDGLVTALEVLRIMQVEAKPLSQLAGGWDDFPQLLVNVPVVRRPDLRRVPQVQQEIQASRRHLKTRGRVNVRYSGTEPLARVMVEAETAPQAETWAHRIADAVETAIGSGQRRKSTWLTYA